MKTHSLGVVAILVWAVAPVGAQQPASPVSALGKPRDVAPLSQLERPAPRAAVADLGRQLFFDGRLSGDATVSCATCHQPEKAWADGLPLSQGYPGALYFRNTPTLLNAAAQSAFYWDARLAGADLPTLVRDHISEAHFMQADGRLVIERLRQVPQYEQQFREVFGGEPSYGRILNAVAAYVQSLRSPPDSLDRFLSGDHQALTEPQQAGLALFRGKAGCVRCHHGPLLSDGETHSIGPPGNVEVFAEPLRHITFRRFFRTLGIAEYQQLREDIGLMGVTKREGDRGRFRTPSLREAARTAPYMHNGSLADLSEVVAFYNRGGGPRQSADLQPLQLDAAEQAALVALLEALGSPAAPLERPAPPPYVIRTLGDN